MVTLHSFKIYFRLTIYNYSKFNFRIKYLKINPTTLQQP